MCVCMYVLWSIVCSVYICVYCVYVCIVCVLSVYMWAVWVLRVLGVSSEHKKHLEFLFLKLQEFVNKNVFTFPKALKW